MNDEYTHSWPQDTGPEPKRYAPRDVQFVAGNRLNDAHRNLLDMENVLRTFNQSRLTGENAARAQRIIRLLEHYTRERKVA